MCGIGGYVSFCQAVQAPQYYKAMEDTMVRRGRIRRAAGVMTIAYYCIDAWRSLTRKAAGSPWS